MAKKSKSKEKEKDIVINIETTFDKVENYIEDNRKSLLFIVGGIVLLVGIYFMWKFFYLEPRTQEAGTKMYKAEMWFAKDSFNLAIQGNADGPGFQEIVNKYGMTAPGNLAKYYLGVCYLHTGDYDKAIKYLKDFDSDDMFLGSEKLGLIGDAYSEKKQTDDAIAYYLKAANNKPNKFTSPLFLKKAAYAYEDKGQKDEALKLFQEIKVEYPESQEATQADKYIIRLGGTVK